MESIPSPVDEARKSRRSRWGRGRLLGTGLLLTFVGLFLLVLLLPSDTGALGRLLPVAAVGMLALWVGGILMGRGSRS